MSRADRDRARRQAVEREKARIRRNMRNNSNDHIYGEETLREATRVKDYVEVDALEELMPEIREHNRKAGGGTKARVKEIQDRTRRREYERRQERDAERSRAQVEDYRRNRPAPDFDAARGASHSSALSVPSDSANDTDAEAEERYRQEMKAYEQRRRDARYEGVLFTEPAPTPPGKKENKRGAIPALPPMDPQVYR